jgi:cystathionine gamma-lyase
MCLSVTFGFNTLAIHSGQEADPTTGALITPIYQTSTFVLDELGKNKGYQYARTHNPTRTALEVCLASLEGAKYGIACASGSSGGLNCA